VKKVYGKVGLVSAAALVAAWVAFGIGGGTTQVCPPYPAFPNAGCTGVPSGVTLTTPALDADNNYVVNTPNTTVSGISMVAATPGSPMGCVVVQRVGVTIKNSRLRCIVTESDADATGATPRLKIQDSEIDCKRDPVNNLGPGTGIEWQNYDVVRTDVRGCENGFDIEKNASVVDSYIHDLSECKTAACIDPDAHTDGFQSGDSSNLTIRHNNVSVVNLPCPPDDGRCAGTGSINLNHNTLTGTFSNTLIKDNLILGGSSWIYCPQATTSNWVVTRNHLSNAWGTVNTTGCTNEDAGDNVIHETNAHFALG
jgi:hypothetical protein